MMRYGLQQPADCLLQVNVELRYQELCAINTLVSRILSLTVYSNI